MDLHNRLTIRQKIILIILAVTLISIVTGFTIELFSNIKTSKNELRSNINLDAELIADYLIPTFMFDDRAGATDVLQKLQHIPSIIYGAAYLPDGRLFAKYSLSDAYDSLKSFPEILKSFKDKKKLLITHPIDRKNEFLGTVVLVASLKSIDEKTNKHIESLLIILAISVLFATLLAFGLERIISGPILRLAKVTKNIGETFDYSVRVEKEANDETGMLYDAFNKMLQSIDARKKERDPAQQILQEERENLEIRVIERTKELNAAKEKAEESDQLKSAFLANMSHEIRTPLNAILGCSSLIRESSATPAELEEYHKMIETGGKDLINLIDDILHISMIEANQLKINLKKTSVSQLANEVFKTFKQSLNAENPGNQVTPVFVEPSDKIDYVLVTDPLRLKQILINILNNSIKFTPEGSIEFCYFANEEKSRMIFYIKDTGIGIPKEQQDKIFERFTKVTDIKTKHYKGTGLGLSIALKLTQLLQGEIRVESTLNVGTAFYVSFPLEKELSITPAPDVIHSDQTLNFLTGKAILIVEDVEYNYRYLEIVLSRNSELKLFWAKNGVEAVEMCRLHPEINIVLMDIQLPVMNGLEATKIIKAENSNLPVLAQTAYANTFDIEACKLAGCDDILVKPIIKDTLIRELKKYIL
jgi:signal transduction histidine kinase